MTARTIDHTRAQPMEQFRRRRMLMWVMRSILCALVAYFGFRGYLSPELLFHFANTPYC